MQDEKLPPAGGKDDDRPRLSAAEMARLRAEYAPGVVDHWLNPRNLGREKDGREIITRATFLSDICIGAVSCGSMLTTLITGREVREAMQLTAEEIRAALGGLPAKEQHCADLAIRTLRQAILDYHQKKAAGWKNLYRRPS